MRDADFDYIPRNPEETTLYQVVAEQLETFLRRQQERDRPVPPFVEEQFRSFLDCGVLARGFVRLRCQSCGHARLTSNVLNVFIRALFGELRRRASQLPNVRNSQCGAVTFVQRFGDALNANPHFHSLVIDGVYAAGENGHPEFHHLPAPEDADVLRLSTIVAERIQSLLERRGLGKSADPEQADPLAEDDPGMAALVSNSVRHKVAIGSNTGRGVLRLGDQIDGDSMDAYQSPLCAMVCGFSMHGNVCVDARDRIRLGKAHSLRRTARCLHGAFGCVAQRPAPLPFETSMARWNHRRHFRKTRLHGQTRRSCTGAARTSDSLPWRVRTCSGMETSDCSRSR